MFCFVLLRYDFAFVLYFSVAASSLKQDDKEVQVDLQDLGYETCGKSENGVDGDENSSPGRSCDP